MEVFARIAGFAMAGYVLYAVLMIWVHPALIYPFAREPFSDMDFAGVATLAPDGEQISLQVHDAGPGRPVILFFMGNAGSLEYFRPVLDMHVNAGRSVVALEYRGGAGRPGSPSETALKADALAAFDNLPMVLEKGHGPVVPHGYSMGSGLALHVASRRPVAGVLLDAPFARMCELMTRASRLPACHLPFVQKWDNMALAAKTDAPVLVLHGLADDLIPPGQSKRLADALKNATFHGLDGAGHNDLASAPAYAPLIGEFVAGLR